jgi:hypothetical protein
MAGGLEGSKISGIHFGPGAAVRAGYRVLGPDKPSIIII